LPHDGLWLTGEMATAVVLLVGTVLVVRTLVKSYQSPVGVRTANVLTMHLDLPAKKYPRPDDTISFYERLQARLQALPGVEAASVASSLPGQDGMDMVYELEGARPPDTRRRPQVRGLVVGAAYFHTMGVRPLVGREFAGTDNGAGAPAAIVNQSFAAKYWPEGHPAGRRLRLIEEGAVQPWLTLVGVVPDIWQNDQRHAFEPLIYLPFSQKPGPDMSVLARTRVPPATLGQAFRREVQALDDDLPVFALRTLEEDIGLHDADARALGIMFGIFTAIAMLLAVVGLYG